MTAGTATPPVTPGGDTPSLTSAPFVETGVGGPGRAQVGGIEGQGPFTQFIVKYRETSSAFQHQAGVQARASESAATSALTGSDRRPLQLIWQRRLGVGADVLKSDRPLDRDEAGRLMQAFASDPEVEYVEIDRIVTHQNRMGI